MHCHAACVRPKPSLGLQPLQHVLVPILPLVHGPFLLFERDNHALVHSILLLLQHYVSRHCTHDSSSLCTRHCTYDSPSLCTRHCALVPSIRHHIAPLCHHPKGRLHHTPCRYGHRLHTTTCRGAYVWMLSRLGLVPC